MDKYGIIIYWSKADQVFIAEVPELPGCVTHGDTQAAALARATEAIESWVNTANEFGDPVPPPREERVSLSRYAADKPISASCKSSTVRRNNPRNSIKAGAPQLVVNPKAH